MAAATERRRGVSASFVVPSGVHIVQLWLLHGRQTVYTTVANAREAGTRQMITIPARMGKRLKPGSYTLSVKTGSSRSMLGPAATREIRLTG
jgi:hypothetical protein